MSTAYHVSVPPIPSGRPITHLRIVAKPVTADLVRTKQMGASDSQVDALDVETAKLDGTAEEAAADCLGHCRDNVLNVAMAEGLVLDVRVAGNVACGCEQSASCGKIINKRLTCTEGICLWSKRQGYDSQKEEEEGRAGHCAQLFGRCHRRRLLRGGVNGVEGRGRR